MANEFSFCVGPDGKPIPAVRSGTAGFVSWRRVEMILRETGELRPFERLVSYRIDGDGLSFRVERMPDD